jgi:hypothetical protein
VQLAGILDETDHHGAERGAQDQRQIGVLLVDALVAHVAVAAHDGPRAGVDAGGLDVGHDRVDRQRLVGGDLDERTEGWRRVQLQGLREELRR